MANAFHVAAIVAGFLGLILSTVSLSTTHWMEGCISMKKVLKAILPSPESNAPGTEEIKFMLEDETLCLHTGLYKISLSIGSLFNFDIAIPISGPNRFAKRTIDLFVFGTIMLVSAIILLILSTCLASFKKNGRRFVHNVVQISIVLYLFGAILIGAALYNYGLSRRDTLHRPVPFIQQINAELNVVMNDMITKAETAPIQKLFARRNNKSLSFSELRSAVFLPEYSQSSSLLLFILFTEINPVFGYSMYFAWLSFLMTVSATGFGLLGCQRTKKRKSSIRQVP